jgi:hypothetical protein
MTTSSLTITEHEALEAAGFVALAPGWPDDPETVAAANANPAVMAHKTIGQIVGHSFGGLLTQILAGRGLGAVSLTIDSGWQEVAEMALKFVQRFV